MANSVTLHNVTHLNQDTAPLLIATIRRFVTYASNMEVTLEDRKPNGRLEFFATISGGGSRTIKCIHCSVNAGRFEWDYNVVV